MYTYCTTQTCCALHAYCSSFPHRDARRALQPNGVKGRPFTSCVIFWFDFFLFSFCAHRGNAFETWGSAPHPAPGGELFLYFLSWPPPLRVLRVLAESSPNPRRVLAKSSPSPRPSPSPPSPRQILAESSESSPNPGNPNPGNPAKTWQHPGNPATRPGNTRQPGNQGSRAIEG
jgi:hypothetical protein